MEEKNISSPNLATHIPGFTKIRSIGCDVYVYVIIIDVTGSDLKIRPVVTFLTPPHFDLTWFTIGAPSGGDL